MKYSLSAQGLSPIENQLLTKSFCYWLFDGMKFDMFELLSYQNYFTPELLTPIVNSMDSKLRGILLGYYEFPVKDLSSKYGVHRTKIYQLKDRAVSSIYREIKRLAENE
jgi:hypothetical protein